MKIRVIRLKDEWRTKQWMVRYYRDRKPVRSFFSSEEEGNQHKRSLQKTFKSGADVTDVSEALRLIAGTGYKLTELVKAGLAWIASTNAAAASPTATFADGAAKFIANAKENKRRMKTIVGYETFYGLLNKVFGSKVGATITASEVKAYLGSLRNRRGQAGMATRHTKISMLRYIKMALRTLGIENPLPTVNIPGEDQKDVQFFSNEEIKTILGATRPCERGMVALATFSAVRPETLEKLPAECVNLAERSIRIPGYLSKDHQTHFLQGTHPLKNGTTLPGIPDVLWEWLAIYPFEPQRWQNLQNRLRDALQGKWIQDGLRHTGATNYCSLFGHVATAELLTHSGTTLVGKFYDGRTSRAKADDFYLITPSSVQFNPRKTKPRYLVWPTDEQLGDLLTQMPAKQLASKLGCSDQAIYRRCRIRHILKPGRGAWTKEAHANQSKLSGLAP